MSAARTAPILDSTTLEQRVPLCCGVALLWLGGGLMAMALFPALRGMLGGMGWMPLFLLVLPASLLVAGLLRRRAAGSVAAPVVSRALRPRRRRSVMARSRRRPSSAARWHLAALLAGIGLHRT